MVLWRKGHQDKERPTAISLGNLKSGPTRSKRWRLRQETERTMKAWMMRAHSYLRSPSCASSAFHHTA
ncbi:hypothetical protein ACVWW6_000364 [Bradyrhizobium sp. USDA 3311]